MSTIKLFQSGGTPTEKTNKPNPAALIYVLYKLSKAGKQPPDEGQLEQYLEANKEEASQYYADFMQKSQTAEGRSELEQDSEFMELYADFMAQQDNQVEFAKKGAKLKTLTTKKISKCSCGCDLILKKDKGGKIKKVCSCNCGK